MQSEVQTWIATASSVDPDVLGHFEDAVSQMGHSTTSESYVSALEELEAMDQDSNILEYDDGSVLTDTAILMGDPGCKGVLTLHSLIAEEEAALALKLGRDVRPSDLKESNPIQFPWRHFSCAGDDHTGIGPDKYLDDIGRNHEKNQMVISHGKHVRSKMGGFYCERVLYKGPNTQLTAEGQIDYSQHVLVDSIKVRLLSPESKDREKEAETNPSIGKARLLFKQLLWSPPGWQRTLNVCVQRRFFGRMWKFLPKLRNGDIDRIAEMPSYLGGLGMCPPQFEGWDLDNVLAQLSPTHLRVIHHVLKGRGIDDFGRRALGRYSSDRYARGIRFDDAVDLIIDRLFDLHWTKEEIQVLGEARRKFKLRESLGYRQVLKHVSKLGYETKLTLKRKLARSYNQACLMIESVNRGFESASWEDRRSTFEGDLLITCINNEIQEEYDLKYIYDRIIQARNSEKLYRDLRVHEKYLDPEYEMEIDGMSSSVLKDLKKTIPDTKLPAIGGFV